MDERLIDQNVSFIDLGQRIDEALAHVETNADALEIPIQVETSFHAFKI